MSSAGADRTVPPGRRRSPLLGTAAITLAAYAALGAALSAEPPVALPAVVAALVAAAPAIIAVVNATALLCLLAGWRAILAGRVRAHRALMLVAAGCISLFLILYVTRVALGGVKAFPGPAAVRTYLYLPVLTVHISLSILSVPLVVHNLLIGLTYPIGEIPRTAHPRVGRWAVLAWSISLALGQVVYLLLNVLY